MKKYCEVWSILPFNWHDAINDLDTPLNRYSSLSRSWVTCAVGNQCSKIPRHHDGSPKDSILRILGSNFHYCVLSNYRASAKNYLEKIERRSIQLLNENTIRS